MKNMTGHALRAGMFIWFVALHANADDRKSYHGNICALADGDVVPGTEGAIATVNDAVAWCPLVRDQGNDSDQIISILIEVVQFQQQRAILFGADAN